MDPVAIIANLAAQAIVVADTLAPEGAHIAWAFSGLAIVLLGIASTQGLSLVGLCEMLFWSAIATWACASWGNIVRGCLEMSNQALALFGAGGPESLFQSATMVASRIAAEPLGFSWWPSEAAAATFRAMLLAFVVPITIVGLSIPGLLALLAQVQLLIGAAVVPLIIPGIAWAPLRPLAMGGITFMISSTLRVITLGLISVVFAKALQAGLVMPSAAEPVTFLQIGGLLLTAILATICGFSGSAIAGSVVGHGVGGLGLSSVTNVASVAAGGVSSMARASGGGGGSSGGGGGASAAGGMVRSPGPIGSRSQGAFP